jgi:hypothetical protein
MSITVGVSKSAKIGGISKTQSSTVTGDGQIVHNVNIPAGDTGVLTTRTDGDTGVFTVGDSAHAFANTDRVDAYWVGGCRRGMAVSGVPSGNAITIDGGSGDDLPDQDTAMTLIEPVELDLSFLGTNVNYIVFHTAQRGQFVVVDDGDAEALAKELGAGVLWDWLENAGEDNPISGDQIEKIYVSHDSASAVIMCVGILYDNA